MIDRLRAGVFGMMCLVGATQADASSSVLLSDGGTGDHLLTISADRTASRSTLSLICTPAKKEYGIVLIAPELRLPKRGANVTIEADGTSLGALRFGRQEEALIYTGEGDTGGTALDKASAAGSVSMRVGGKRVAFKLAEGPTQVAAFREKCQLAPK